MNKLILPRGMQPLLPFPADMVKLESGEVFSRDESDSELVRRTRYMEFVKVPRGTMGENVCAVWHQVGKVGPGIYGSMKSGMVVFMGYTVERESGQTILHASINMGRNGMDWEVFRAFRYGFFPEDATVIQVFPPRDQYVNDHATVWHLWQMPGGWSPSTI